MSERTIEELRNKLKDYGAQKIPFIFIIDFEMKKPFACRLDTAAQNNIYFEINGNSNYTKTKENKAIEVFNIFPLNKKVYTEAFNLVQGHINKGDSYLVNLTFKSRLETNLSLMELFHVSHAQYKLFFRNDFIVFSPECFIKINSNQIYSFPMKGTIDADIPEASEKILKNEKELYEHNTIVDLIRNDISMVASEVEVSRFRYLSTIYTNQKKLLQVSSEIKGKLTSDWTNRIDDILFKILPAGSISGAPKRKTVEIIKKAEKEERGYFTGIFGIFDGKDLDCAVNIRYIEKTNNDLYFRSGGGITALSDLDSEYEEMINKIYVPIA